MYGLTSQDLDRVIAFINGEDPDLMGTDIPERLARVCFDMQRRILAGARASNKAAEKAEARLAIAERKLEDRQRHQVVTGEFPNLGLDSVDVIHALASRMLTAAPHLPLSKGKAMLLLYECYAVWLAGHKEIIVVEAPVYTKFGPQFWRAWNHFDRSKATSDAFADLQSRNAGLAKVVERVADKYTEYAESSLREYYLKSMPLLEMVQDGAGWNTPLNTTSIFQWKAAQSG